ncbi:MAG TPA: hypothetical protein VJR29_01035 [bacterium]|nr:hypothetical protein [bacterium]
MQTKLRLPLLILAFSLFSLPVRAETLNGVVRNVNHGSHSFGLDVPPMTRVYVTGGTTFEAFGEKSTFKDLKEGDRAEVQGRSPGPGVFHATKVSVSANLEPVKEMGTNEVSILPGQSFLLGVNQVAVMREEGKDILKIRSTEFINTLCKGGYDCSGEGEVGMRMKVSVKGKGEEEIILTSKNHRKPTSPVKVQLGEFEIQLMEAGEDVVSLVVRKG